MTTVREIVTDALIQLGVCDPSESATADQAASALRELNRMIQAWNTEDLMIYTVDRQVFTLTVNKQFYTIGIGGDFVTTYPVRPGQIDLASVLVSSGTVEIPIEILNDEQWRDTTVKQVNSGYPLAMWSNGNYPLNTLAFWPVPQQVNSVVLYIWGQTSSFSDINASVTMPQGYEDALVSNLAIRLSPAYGVQPNPVLLQMAAQAKSRIKRMNWEPTYRSTDPALLGSHNSIGQRSRGYVID